MLTGLKLPVCFIHTLNLTLTLTLGLFTVVTVGKMNEMMFYLNWCWIMSGLALGQFRRSLHCQSAGPGATLIIQDVLTSTLQVKCGSILFYQFL